MTYQLVIWTVVLSLGAGAILVAVMIRVLDWLALTLETRARRLHREELNRHRITVKFNVGSDAK